MDLAALEALASTASAAVVTAAATDLFETVRRQVALLFGRGEPDQNAEKRLALTRERLTKATAPAELERVQADERARWRTRLADLVIDHPDAELEVRGLVEDLQRELRVDVAASGHSVAAGRDV